jgi:hypothetical protein
MANQQDKVSRGHFGRLGALSQKLSTLFQKLSILLQGKGFTIYDGRRSALAIYDCPTVKSLN